MNGRSPNHFDYPSALRVDPGGRVWRPWTWRLESWGRGYPEIGADSCDMWMELGLNLD